MNTIESPESASRPEASSPKTAGTSTKGSGRAKKAASTRKSPKGAKGRRSSKKARVIVLMKRASGATMPEIKKATKWQSHTIRGFVSLLASKGGLKIESSTNDSGDRVYRLSNS